MARKTFCAAVRILKNVLLCVHFTCVWSFLAILRAAEKIRGPIWMSSKRQFQSQNE